MRMRLATRQLAFDLPSDAAYRLEDFMPSASNATALDAIKRWPNWPTGLLLIDGPAGAGKTHLARIWADQANAAWLEPAQMWADPTLPTTLWQRLDGYHHAVLDGADQVADEPLLHLYNIVRERSGALLLTASSPLGSWLPRLPDLSSRLLTGWTVHIGAPQDEFLAALLMKQFADRRLPVEPDVVHYLSTHMERSFAFVRGLVDACDRTCWQIKRPLTLPLARAVLQRELGARHSDNYQN